MGCANSKTIDEKTNLSAPADFQGPTENRGCTDVFCLLLIIASWAAMTLLGLFAVQHGDYRRILNPIDYNGNMCGLNNTEHGGIDMTDYEYLYPVNLYGGGVCVKECPNMPNQTVDPFTLVTYSGLYDARNGTAIFSTNVIEVADYSQSNYAYECTEQKCFPNVVESWSSEGINEGYGYAFYLVDTSSYMKQCLISGEALAMLRDITADAVEQIEESISAVKNSTSIAKSLYSDIYTAKTYIFGFGFCLATVIGFVYLSVLRIPCALPFMVWGSIFAALAMFGGIGYYARIESLEWKAEDPQKHTEDEVLALKIFGYVAWGLGGLLFLIVIALRRRIVLAIGLVKESSKAVAAMPLLTIFPALQCGAIVAFVLVWMFYAVHLASLGEFQPVTLEMNNVTLTFRSFEYDREIELSGWFLLFCFFWTTQFILALGEIIIAMSVGKWYFSRDRSAIGNTTVVSCICKSLFYHAGTAAFGSLIIAVIQTISAFLAYIQRHANRSGSRIAKAIMCCLQCFMFFLEKFMKFVNKNAYIQCAIFGTNFCASARESFFLILRNVARVGILAVICEVLVFVGKVFIAIVTGGCSYILIDRYAPIEITSPTGPVVFITVLAYFVGSSFMGVFSVAVTTTLQCFIADEEMFNGSEAEAYTPKSLRSWIDDHGSTAKGKNKIAITSK